VLVISTRRLTRRFGEIVAVRDLDLDVARGGVVGLVGPNGSGKSTLIRLLLGLIRPSGGEATVFGQSISHPRSYASRVGALIESPAFIPSLSARANLRSLAQLRGVSDRRVNEVLDIVGLLDRAKEPAKQFSLGMKQRLGIAAALLPDPELLVLDEPTNGLDPAGIVEIRGLLRRLGDEGRTVVVSSHLLSEIEAACDTLAVIRYGELLYSGPLADLVAQAGEAIEVVPEFPADLVHLGQLLVDSGWTAVVREGDVHISAQASLAADVNRLAAAAGITLRELRLHEASLEEVFLRLTGAVSGDHRDAEAPDLSASDKVEVPS
jgi:ABC-2 type transport system ATP-binding protein